MPPPQCYKKTISKKVSQTKYSKENIPKQIVTKKISQAKCLKENTLSKLS